MRFASIVQGAGILPYLCSGVGADEELSNTYLVGDVVLCHPITTLSFLVSSLLEQYLGGYRILIIDSNSARLALTNTPKQGYSMPTIYLHQYWFVEGL